MAIPWLAALQVIPWGQVLQHAPWVLDQAKDLLRRRAESAEASAAQSGAGERPNSLEPAALLQRIEHLERLTRQQQEMLEEQARMIAALAEQASTLIAAVDRMRSRLRRMLWLLGIGAVLTAFVWALSR